MFGIVNLEKLHISDKVSETECAAIYSIEQARFVQEHKFLSYSVRVTTWLVTLLSLGLIARGIYILLLGQASAAIAPLAINTVLLWVYLKLIGGYKNQIIDNARQKIMKLSAERN
jgi:hypothetical protein